MVGAGGIGPDAVAAVVVSYNSRRHLEVCLASLAQAGVDRLVVADNSSADGSQAVAEAAGAEWLPTGGNLGYGRAANLGAGAPGAAAADYLLICNPDIEARPGSVAALVRALEADPALGAVGPRLSNSDGSLYPSARTFPDLVDAMGHGLLGLVAPTNRFTRRYRLLDWDHSSAARVDWVSGACFLVRRSAWNQVGGFDPAFFMYMEDVDLCWRLGRAGWAVGYEPAAEVVHVQGVSADLHPYRMLLAHHRSMWLFARRTTRGHRRLALPLVAGGLMARFVVASARRLLFPAGRRGRRPLP
ncbi:MAG: glycosyltransferase family 2 protein [Actinomycetota bacterium]|nr:glycosyltransferase family 2 protein [Actinomycetota bacterium]